MVYTQLAIGLLHNMRNLTAELTARAIAREPKIQVVHRSWT